MEVKKNSEDRLPGESGPENKGVWLKNIDRVSALALAVLIFFVVTLLTVYFFPIYPDEIQVRMGLSRLPIISHTDSVGCPYVFPLSSRLSPLRCTSRA